jgi:cytochrome P450
LCLPNYQEGTDMIHKTEPISPEIFDDEFIQDPHPMYAYLREHEPVFRASYPVESFDIWLVNRYEDVRNGLTDTRINKQRKSITQGPMVPEGVHNVLRGFHTNLIMVDPPQHTRMRRLITRELTSTRVKSLRAEAQAYTDALIDAIAPHGKADIMSEIATPLPLKVLGEMLLGIGPSPEWEAFQETAMNIVAPRYEFTKNDYDSFKLKMNAFVLDLIADRRAKPGSDMISSFVAAHANADLSDDELIGLTVTILLAGFATTSFLIGNGIATLLRHPDQLQLLREKPELLGTALDELIRYEGPMQTATLRFASEDIEMSGRCIPQGSIVTFSLDAAHRDPRVYDKPDELDITRKENPHMGFGHGVHSCPGNQLGRMLASMAIGGLVQRFPDLALAVDPSELQWRPGILHRGLFELPVTFTPVSPAL